MIIRFLLILKAELVMMIFVFVLPASSGTVNSRENPQEIVRLERGVETSYIVCQLVKGDVSE